MANGATSYSDMPIDVANVYATFPVEVRMYLSAVRTLIQETAQATPGVGPLSETLKWGEPSYLTDATRAGTTVRLAWKQDKPRTAQLLVNCQTSLIEDWRNVFGDELVFSGNRAVLLDIDAPLPKDALASCISQALTYHLRKKSA